MVWFIIILCLIAKYKKVFQKVTVNAKVNALKTTYVLVIKMVKQTIL